MTSSGLNKTDRFRFSLRSLLLLMLVVVLAIGFWARGWHRQKRLAAIVAAHNGDLRYRFQNQEDVVRPVRDAKPWAPAWLVSRFGLDAFCRADSVVFPDDAKLSTHELKEILVNSGLRSLVLPNVTLDDETVDQIACLENLQHLFLDNSNLSDTQLRKIVRLSDLGSLGLAGTNVTGDGLDALKNMPKLGWFVLDSSQVTATGLHHIRNSSVTSLWIVGTEGTVAKIADLPNLVYLAFDNVDDASIDARSLPGLRHIHLQENSAEVVMRLLPEIARLPKFLDESEALESIHFIRGQLPDEAAEILSQMTHLSRLQIHDCGFSDEARRKVEAALPKTQFDEGRLQPVKN